MKLSGDNAEIVKKFMYYNDLISFSTDGSLGSLIWAYTVQFCQRLHLYEASHYVKIFVGNLG